MTEQPINPELTSDDKLWAALCYVPYLNPIISIVMLVMEDKKARPFIKFHAVQSIVLGILAYILTPLCGLGILVAIYMLYLAYTAYQGQSTVVPVVTDFIKNQGWA
jgi:uncharacterized membrane protein